MTRPVHIVATGVRCAVGITAESAAAAIRAGISRVAEHPFMMDAAGEKLRCAREPTIDPALISPERMVLLAERALREAVGKLGPAGPNALEVPVIVALPEPRPGFSAQNAASVSRTLAMRVPPALGAIRVELLGEGHAGALLAIQRAVERVSEGSNELCIAGGVDTYFDADTLDWLESELRVAREEIRSGFSPGEGAAMVVVASDAACGRFGLHSLAHVRGIGCAREQRSPKSDEGLLGEGLSEAVARATADLRLPQEVVSDVYGDINSERARTEDWGFALMRAAEHFCDGAAYVTAVGQCGDIGAATGALGCALAVEAWRRSYARGPRAMIWAGSWSGLRGAVVLEKDAR